MSSPIFPVLHQSSPFRDEYNRTYVAPSGTDSVISIQPTSHRETNEDLYNRLRQMVDNGLIDKAQGELIDSNLTIVNQVRTELNRLNIITHGNDKHEVTLLNRLQSIRDCLGAYTQATASESGSKTVSLAGWSSIFKFNDKKKRKTIFRIRKDFRRLEIDLEVTGQRTRRVRDYNTRSSTYGSWDTSHRWSCL